MFGGLSSEFWVHDSVAPSWVYGGKLTRFWFLISKEFRIK